MKDMLQRSLRYGLLVSLAALGVACGSDNLYQLKNQSAMNEADVNLTAGAAISELTDFSIRLTEQYALKDDMSQQFSLMSHCKEIDADKMLCALTDKDGDDAKVIGVETIISESAYQKLSDEEKAAYHSHKDELTSGRMVVSGATEDDVKSLMDKLSNTFGKAELFMMPGADKAMEKAMLLTTIDGGSLGIMGGKEKPAEQSKEKPADQSGDLTSGSKSADQSQSMTSGEQPTQSQGAIEQPQDKEPKSEEPAQKDEPKEPMKATQTPVQGQSSVQSQSSVQGQFSMAQNAPMPAMQSQGSFSAQQSQQSQGSFAAQSQAPVEQPKAEEPKSEEPKDKEGEQPAQASQNVAGQNAMQGTTTATQGQK